MIKLECKKIKFYSVLDEFSFFERVGKIKCIESWEGNGDCIFIYIKSKKISDVCLRELIALFYRYKIDTHLLAIFMSDKNKIWLLNDAAFWHKKMFKN